MGVQTVSLVEDKEQMQHFVRNLLKDVKALEHMLDNDWFESDITRIGAEQEMCLVDKNFKPAPIAMEVLAKQNYPWLETELARFNLETNLTPRTFVNKCLSDMEFELKDSLDKVQAILDEFESKVFYTKSHSKRGGSFMVFPQKFKQRKHLFFLVSLFVLMNPNKFVENVMPKVKF